MAAQEGDYPGLTRLQLTAIALAQFHEAMQVTLPYTLAVFFVRDFASGPQDTEEHVGRLTGLLAASFSFGQFLTSYAWGRIGDTIGRKPLVIMSNISSLATVLVFGLTSSYAAAMTARLLGGLFNCTFLCVKAMIGESCHMEKQAKPLSYLSLSWGLGTILGPSLGGLLSRPCSSFGHDFPLCHSGQLFDSRPFLLPCLAVSCVSLAAALSSILLLSETLPKRVHKQYLKAAADEPVILASTPLSKQGVTELAFMHRQASGSSLPAVDATLEAIAEDASVTTFTQPASAPEENGHRQPLQRGDSALSMHNSSHQAGDADGKGGKNIRLSEDSIDEEQPAHIQAHTNEKAADGNESEDDDDEGRALLSESSSNKLADQERQFPGRDVETCAGISGQDSSERIWYKDRETIVTLCGYCSIAFSYNLVDEMMPIYASAPIHVGGLELSTSQLAIPLAAGGAAIISWSLLGYPWLRSKLGTRNTCRTGLLGSSFMAILIALPSAVLARHKAASIAMLAAVVAFQDLCANNAFTSSMIMVNTAAPRKSMGAVNGLGQALACFVRAAGPALGGILWGLSTIVPIAGHQFLPFACVSFAFLATQTLYTLLPKGFAG